MSTEEQKHRMMAFLDDELSSEDRLRFMEECYTDPDLAEELAGFRRVADVASSMRLREPEDHEYERLYTRVATRIERTLGWALLGLGVASLTAYGVVSLLTSALPVALRISIGLIVAGLLTLGWHVIRVRLRMRRFDRYVGVVR